MKADVFHELDVPAFIKELEIEVRQEGEPLVDVVAAGVSHSDYYLIHGYRTPREVMVYGRFLAGQQPYGSFLWR